jgi:hypothetical protein
MCSLQIVITGRTVGACSRCDSSVYSRKRATIIKGSGSALLTVSLSGASERFRAWPYERLAKK